jgi:hypothetical protein
VGWTHGTDGRRHSLFDYDEAFAPFGTVVKGCWKRDKATGLLALDEETGMPTVVGNPHFLGLEIRLGAKPGETTQLQTVVPPSRTLDGRQRRWNGNKVILPAPPSLLAHLARHAPPQPKPKPGPAASDYAYSTDTNTAEWQRTDPFTVTGGGASVERRAIAYLATIDPAEDGNFGSNPTLRAAAVLVVRFALPDDVGFRLLREHYNPRCLPPWSDEQLRHKIESAHKDPKHPYGDLLEPGDPGYGKGRNAGANGTHTNGKQADPGGGFGSTTSTTSGKPGDGPPSFDGIEPRPLDGTAETPKPFAADMLPAWVWRWLSNIAARTNTSVAMGVAIALVALGSVLGRKLAIHPKKCADWPVVPCFWGYFVAPPGSRKTSVLNEVLGPIRTLEREREKRFEQETLPEWRAKDRVAKGRRDAADAHIKREMEKQAKANQSLEERKEADSAFVLMVKDAAQDDGEPPACPRLTADDFTPEALARLEIANPNGILITKDEMSNLLHVFGKHGHELTRSYLLSGHGGFGQGRVDRASRPSQLIDPHCLSVIGGIQPGLLHLLLPEEGVVGSGDGFAPRFSVGVWPDRPPLADLDVSRDTDAIAAITNLFRSLDTLDPAALGCEWDAAQRVHFLRLEPDAQVMWSEWFRENERATRDEDRAAIVREHLLKFPATVAGMGLLFHVIDHLSREGEDRPAKLPPVSLGALAKAVTVGKVLLTHAAKIYGEAGVGTPESVRKLARAIMKGRLSDPFTVREVVRGLNLAGLQKADDVRRAAGWLVERDWLTKVPGARGEAERYHINPACPKAAETGEEADRGER